MKVMIIGAGKLGYKLATTMLNSEYEVTLMDSDSKVIERMNDHLDVLTVTANGIEVVILKELGIETYDVLVASTGNDETNTIICALAKRLGCHTTIARIRNPEYTEQLDFIKQEMGIDHVINSDLLTATEMARYLLDRDDHYVTEFAKGKVKMILAHVNRIKGFGGERIIDLPNFEDLLICAIRRGESIIIPSGGSVLEEGDILYIIGLSESIAAFRKRYHIGSIQKLVKQVMIVGGGNVGYYLAQQLSQQDISVTIVEQRREKCKQLTNSLVNALIIHGDGTDINLLEEEALGHMDAFVGVTGLDEQNLLMSLMAKQVGTTRAIAKISRLSYLSVVDRLGIDVAMNPISLSVSDIMKFIRGHAVAAVSLLLGDHAEITELVIDSGVPAIGKRISELDLPKGIIVGALVRKDSASIPNGFTIIQEGDRLITFSLAEQIQALNIFMKTTPGGPKHVFWHRRKSTR